MTPASSFLRSLSPSLFTHQEKVWQEVKHMSQKEVKCPYCGRELLNELGSEESQVAEIVKFPQCGSTRT
jgi:DNA-directed RNA polymerase subunit RPC12/RpoP